MTRAVTRTDEPRPGRRRLRNTVRAANIAMLACIDDLYQYLAAEALAGVIRRQAQAGRMPSLIVNEDDTADLFAPEEAA